MNIYYKTVFDIVDSNTRYNIINATVVRVWFAHSTVLWTCIVQYVYQYQVLVVIGILNAHMHPIIIRLRVLYYANNVPCSTSKGKYRWIYIRCALKSRGFLTDWFKILYAFSSACMFLERKYKWLFSKKCGHSVTTLCLRIPPV